MIKRISKKKGRNVSSRRTAAVASVMVFLLSAGGVLALLYNCQKIITALLSGEEGYDFFNFGS